MEFKTSDATLNAAITWFWRAFYAKYENRLKLNVEQDTYDDTFKNNRRDLQICVKGFVALACHALFNFLPVTKLLEECLEDFSKFYQQKASHVAFISDKDKKAEALSNAVAALVPTTCKDFLQKYEGNLGARSKPPLQALKRDVEKLCREGAKKDNLILDGHYFKAKTDDVMVWQKIDKYLEILQAITVIVETAIKPEVVIPLVSNASITLANEAAHQGRLSFENLKDYFKVAQVGEKLEDSIAEISWAVKGGYPEREMIIKGSPQHLYIRPLLASDFDVIGKASKVSIFLLLKYFTTVTSIFSLEN